MNRPKVGPGKVRADCGHRTDMWFTLNDGRTVCAVCAPDVIPTAPVPAKADRGDWLRNTGGAA